MSRILLLISLSLLSLISPNFVSAKSYTIDNALIDIQINPDGTANATETRTYSFNGHYENGEWNIDTDKNKIDINTITLSENGVQYTKDESMTPGTYFAYEGGDKLTVKWKYSANDETKDFTIKYKIIDAVHNYTDTAEFYWKFIGTGWLTTTQQAKATVHLPFTAPDTHLKAWGHGPLNGKVSITSPSDIVFEVTDLPPKTFMEGRIIFPTLNGMKVIQENKLNDITQEEEGYIRKTIENNKRSKMAPVYVALYLSLIGLVYLLRLNHWYSIWKEKGKEMRFPEVNLSGTLHEPPSDLEPAMVEALLSFTYVPSTKSLTATLLDLCRQKIIKISQVKKPSILGIFSRNNETVFEIKNEFNTTDIKRGVVHLLYLDEQNTISNTEIIKKLKKDAMGFSKWNSWQSKVKQALFDEGYLDTGSKKLKQSLVTEIVISGILSYLLLMLTQLIGIFQTNTAIPIFSVGIGTSLYIAILIIFYITMDKRTLKGAQEAAAWKAFKKYLKDYSVTKRYPLESVIIWEKYLVYGAALGISLKALSELPIKFKDTTQSSYLYAAGISDGGRFDFGSLSSGFNSLSSSYGASGSGSSGGFSGGGGGGGGGSGGGMS